MEMNRPAVVKAWNDLRASYAEVNAYFTTDARDSVRRMFKELGRSMAGLEQAMAGYLSEFVDETDEAPEPEKDGEPAEDVEPMPPGTRVVVTEKEVVDLYEYFRKEVMNQRFTPRTMQRVEQGTQALMSIAESLSELVTLTRKMKEDRAREPRR